MGTFTIFNKNYNTNGMSSDAKLIGYVSDMSKTGNSCRGELTEEIKKKSTLTYFFNSFLGSRLK